MKSSFAVVHDSWRPIIDAACAQMDPAYLARLQEPPAWLPGLDTLFSAFSLPLPKTRYVLLGESPYPRATSANGYAFWDGAVSDLWSSDGLSKPVNRATSLRNFIKMLLLAEGRLTGPKVSQADIAALPKAGLVRTADDLFGQLLAQGFLLLNASLVLSARPVVQDAKAWRPFMLYVLDALAKQQEVTLILWGAIAKTIDNESRLAAVPRFVAEHPYNISFITNPHVQAFFAPLQLLALRN